MEPCAKISIIVPVYNVAPYLRQCLDSLVRQTYQNLEIICVNDGSIDESGDILQEYAAADDRIRVLTVPNSGVSSARNTALDCVNGEYVMFVDGDDWTKDDTCERALEKALAFSADVVLWPYVREYPNASAPKSIFPDEVVFDRAGCRDLQRHMVGLTGQELAHPERADALSTVWGKLYRREIIEKNALQFVDLQRIGTYEDGLFNLHYFAHAACAVYLPAHLYHYRKYSGMTAKHRPGLAAQWKNLFFDMRAYLTEAGRGAELTQALNNRVSLSIIGLGLNALALPRAEALVEVRAILSDADYRAAIKTLPLRYFPPHWWVFFVCCKANLAPAVLCLLRWMERMRG